jgi:DNA recombination protein RmuC
VIPLPSLIAVIGTILGLTIGLILGLRLGSRGNAAREAGLQDRLTEAQVGLSQRDARVETLVSANASLQATLEERQRALEAEHQQTEKLREVFAALSQDALSHNSQEFLKLAQQSFETLSKTAQGDLATREQAIKGLVDPLADNLKRYETALQSLEAKRQTAYASLDERLKGLGEAEARLQQETTKLVNALRRPEVRGRWGEMQLRNAAELAGMSEYCDFTEQVSVEGGAQRPDMVVNLPGGKRIVVDAKVPLDAYLRAVETADPDQHQQFMLEHAAQCRRHLEGLTKKAYWQQFDDAPDCVVMFVPGESLFAAAVEADSGLLDYGLRSKVIMATPATLIAMLYAVSYGWRQQTFTENAEAVRDLAAEMYDRLCTFADHFQGVGKALNSSVGAYNRAVGSLETRVAVSARKLKDMRVSDKDLPEVTPLEVIPRQLGPELTEPPAGAERRLPEGEA